MGAVRTLLRYWAGTRDGDLRPVAAYQYLGVGGGSSVVWYVTCWLPRGGGGVSEFLVLVRALTKVDILAKVL